MQVRAAVMRAGDGPFTLEQLELEEPRGDEVLVRMVATGMCHTDLLSRELPPEFFGGPQVYGHEGSGVVEAVGDSVTKVAPGDHVVLSFNHCGSCKACDQGKLPYCLRFGEFNMSGGRPDGSKAFVDDSGDAVGSHFFGQSSFASHSVVAETSVVKIDPSYDLARMGPLGCGIQTGAGAILNTLDVQAGSSVVITGAGALGLSAVMAAKVAGAEIIIAVDRHANRLELASKYGATHTISGAPAEITAGIHEATGGGADYAFDTTGNAAVVRASFEGLNNLGTIGLAGVGFGDATFDFISLIGGRTITGVMEGDSTPDEFIPRLAKLNADGEFPFDELITTFPLDQINDAEAASADGSVIKPVLLF
ncbi:NAD(P)-dependent alcohol dehydrogenase [Ilumatobacter coccineus]|uniref:Aryl-alcohol dehydrogenase n=1 Tax=Ilumatobacter coccineus (strain NBRC 103263 / KCTC 29153 / YM16-304) TaxID=1313172 RepID=A0A6C7E6Y6_ILUCY|nr:NAD(P)-dependent alcohol dehydrogenase [Ilumatobacter coccineus]BAN03464.1 aryl-alcohol dehydrogenase [Ilumatobacter coccineus YM16-304]